MVLRLPKEHVAGGIPLKIKYANINGGCFSFQDKEILVGKDYDDLAVLTFLGHELIEASTVGHMVRYGAQDEQYVYVLDHRTFSIICSELAATVLKLLKANGYKEEKG